MKRKHLRPEFELDSPSIFYDNNRYITVPPMSVKYKWFVEHSMVIWGERRWFYLISKNVSVKQSNYLIWQKYVCIMANSWEQLFCQKIQKTMCQCLTDKVTHQTLTQLVMTEITWKIKYKGCNIQIPSNWKTCWRKLNFEEKYFAQCLHECRNVYG